MSKLTGVSLFTGGGLCDIGLRDLVEFVGGVEYDAAIAAHASLALGHTVLCASVVDVDYKQWAGVDYLHMSPPCTNASVANANAGETDNDTALSGACCRAIREIRPRFVTLENVAGYAQFTAFQDILECLASEGFAVHWRVYDSASFGVPQHRKRIMLRARRDGLPIPEVIPTHGSPKDVETNRVQMKMFEDTILPWNGWYAAVADLLPDCPDSKLAPWQIKRLTAQYGEGWLENLLMRYGGEASQIAVPAICPSPTLTSDGCSKARAILVAGEAGGKNGLCGLYTPQTTIGDEPIGTLKAKQCGMKAVLLEGQSKGNRPPSLVDCHLPSPTQAGTGGGNLNRAILVTGEFGGRNGPISLAAESPADTVSTLCRSKVVAPYRIVALTPRCLARFQSVPDDYPLPEKKSLATKIIGNGVPCAFARAVFGSMLGGKS